MYDISTIEALIDERVSQDGLEYLSTYDLILLGIQLRLRPEQYDIKLVPPVNTTTTTKRVGRPRKDATADLKRLAETGD